jgi:hypothetical protein
VPFTGIRPLLLAQSGKQLAADPAVLLFIGRLGSAAANTVKRSARLTVPTILRSCNDGHALSNILHRAVVESSSRSHSS